MAEELEEQETERLCFAIGEIGNAGTEERDHADYFLEYIVKPVLSPAPFNYRVVRADEIADPGIISEQIIGALFDAGLVVADMTNHNANAFYELSVRHMVEKPVVQMIVDTQRPPFDVADFRAISYSLKNPKSIEAAKLELHKAVSRIQEPDFKVSNPITKARGRIELSQSQDSSDQLIATVLDRLDSMGKRIDRVEQSEDHSLYNKLYGPIISDVSSGSNVATKNYLLAALKNQGRTVSEGVLSRLWQENVEGVAHTDIDRAINPGILEQLPQETQTDQKIPEEPNDSDVKSKK
jgi:hypothetical protein